MSQTSAPTGSQLELRDYLRVFRRQAKVIAAVTVGMVVVVVGISLRQTRVYEARAEVLLNGGAGSDVVNGTPNRALPTDGAIQAEIALMRGRATTVAIQKRIGYRPEVKISAKEKAPVIVVAARSSSAEEAADRANAFVTAYLSERRDVIARDLEASEGNLRSELERLDLEIATTRNEIDELNAQIEATADPSEKILLTVRRDRLESEISTGASATRIATLQTKLDQLAIAAQFNANQSGYTVAGALVPQSPIAPQPIRNGFIALVAGLLLGVSLAFFRAYLDDTFTTKEDLDAVSGGVPVLSIVPAIVDWRDRKQAVLEAVTHPNSPASESYRTLRTNLEFVGIDQDLRIIHVTSSSPGEGKSTTSANLAVTLARAGKRVVLVDCDLRRPRLHQFFELENEVGFTTVLLGTTGIQDVLQPVSGIPGLLLLPSGPPPPNPAELLSSDLARSKLQALAKSADYVVVDSPPLLPVSDSIVLAGYADATLLVVTARSTQRRALLRSMELLQQVEAPLEGLILNGASSEATYGYGYGYGYGYRSRYSPYGTYTPEPGGGPKPPAPAEGRKNGTPVVSGPSAELSGALANRRSVRSREA